MYSYVVCMLVLSLFLCCCVLFINYGVSRYCKCMMYSTHAVTHLNKTAMGEHAKRHEETEKVVEGKCLK